VLGRDRSFSLQAIERLLNGMPAVPQLGFSFVDVRDTADLHLLAMTNPEAGGRRFIATTDWMWFIDVARVLRERLGDRASKVPTRVAPNILIRLMSLFDASVRTFVGDLGVKSEFSNEAARSIGWSPRPVDDSIAECAESLLANPA